MEKAKHQSRLSGPDSVILTSASIFMGVLATATLISRKRQKRPVKQTAAPEELADAAWAKTLQGPSPHQASTFFELRLPRLEYEALRKIGGSMLVFQFYYPKESNCGSPTLYAYNMKTGHVATGGRPAILDYAAPSNLSLRGRDQVLGDQQVDINKLEKLIKESPGGKDRNFTNLVFRPRFIEKNPHIAYDITVDGAGRSETANPSPPG